MTRMKVAFILLVISIILKVVTNEIINNESIDIKADEKIANLEKTVLGLVSRIQKVEETVTNRLLLQPSVDF